MSRPRWVLDASVAVKLVVEEEGSDRALGLLARPVIAPDFLRVECANVLWRLERKGVIAPGGAFERLGEFSRLPIAFVTDADLLPGALVRGLRHGHPVCDCLYLEAAARLGHTLVTEDRRLARLADDGAEVVLLSDLPA